MAKVLIVENDPQVQQFYREILIAYDHQVVSSFTAEGGIDKIKNDRPDIVILDMDLGSKLTGRDVVLALKKIDKLLPVLIVSGKSGMKEDPEILLSPNVRYFFVKPVSIQKLTEAIAKEIGNNIVETQDIVQDFSLEDLIGTGGCGSVYRGTYLGKQVAIKILSVDNSSNQSIERFQREAEYLSKIKHLNIVELYHHGQDVDGSYYIIMEYFQGKELEHFIEEQAFGEKEACFIVKEVTEGLNAAHRLGIIHRDIKPSNILYNREDRQVKIIDFGIARQHQANNTITIANSVLGTPAFMSPEQCMGEKLTPVSDIYSLGATFYKLVTGSFPFPRLQAMQVMHAQVCEPLTWSHNEAISEKLRAIIGKMMEKEPENRYQSMTEIMKDLEYLQG